MDVGLSSGLLVRLREGIWGKRVAKTRCILEVYEIPSLIVYMK